MIGTDPPEEPVAPSSLDRYPALAHAQVPAHGPLDGQEIVHAWVLPSGRALSVHLARKLPADGGVPFATGTLALWRAGACEALLRLGDLGYFEYSHTNATRTLADVAELADGGIAALVWGEKDADGQYRLIHDSYLWAPGETAPEVLQSTAWHQAGHDLLLWDCRQQGGPSEGSAVREPFAPDRVVRRLPLA